MVDLEKLRDEQLKLAGKVTISDTTSIKTIAGIDQAVMENKVVSAIVVCDKELKVKEKKYAVAQARMPYKSGFLFYREGPAAIEAFNALNEKPDVVIVSSNGILHPRRIGMASQLGVLLDVATIGIAKRLMLGEVQEGTIYVDKEARGYELKTREHSNPIYMSPGHNISLKTSLETIKKCLKYPHKLPEPLHFAHQYVKKLRKELIDK